MDDNLDDLKICEGWLDRQAIAEYLRLNFFGVSFDLPDDDESEGDIKKWVNEGVNKGASSC